ncbi:MAG: ABC transporter permease [Gemmatimonadota bacterium]
MGSLQSDVLYAVRSLRAAPAFCLLGVVTLGLGIACLSAVFAIVESVVLRPLPYPEPDRLVVVLRSDVEGATPSVSWPDLRDWRDQSTGFDGLTGYANASMTFEWDGGAEEIPGAYVLPDFFDVFGVPLHLGRSFSPSEAVFGGAEAIVLSHHMWTERFGADPQVIGTTVPLASGPATIIGVAGAGFAAPNDRSDYWLPLQEDELLAEAGLPTGRRTLAFIEVLGRMERGADVSDVQTRLRGLALGIDEGAGKTEEQLSRVTLHSLAEWTVIEVRRGLYVLFAAALLVLLVAVANAAALGVSRATSRRAEAALRAALGASPHSLLRQALLEGAIVAISAGVVGTLVAGLSLPTLMDFAPQGLPRGTSVDVRASTLLFASAATFVTGLFFGMGPAVVAARVAPSGILSLGRGAGPSAAELRPQRFLVVSQVALTVVLLTGAMLLSLSFSRVLGVERGFAAEGVLVASLAPSEQRYPTPADLEVLYDEILLQVRALPGVSHASTTYTPPLSNREFRTTVLPTTGPAVGEDPLWATTVVAAQDYFAASGISLLRGRDFDSNDRLSSEPVVIVNELMANRFWPGEDAVGKQVSFAGSIGGVADSFDRAFFPTQPMTVIGVAANVRRAQLSAPPKPEYYRPHSPEVGI